MHNIGFAEREQFKSKYWKYLMSMSSFIRFSDHWYRQFWMWKKSILSIFDSRYFQNGLSSMNIKTLYEAFKKRNMDDPNRKLCEKMNMQNALCGYFGPGFRFEGSKSDFPFLNFSKRFVCHLYICTYNRST